MALNSSKICKPFPSILFQGNCLHTVLKEFTEKGICDNGYNGYWFDGDTNPFKWPSRKCANDSKGWITDGVCSDELENSFSLKRECAQPFRGQRLLILQSLFFLIRSMCKTEKAFNLFSASSVGPVLSRLVPIEAVFEYPDGQELYHFDV